LPIYEYRCLKCGKRVEKIQKFSDPPLKTHEGCGGKVERVLNAPSLQFKGSGFYITDYAKKPAPAEGSSAPSAESSAKSDAGTTKTPAAGVSQTKKSPGEKKKN
jgi:putative FmdB family regulatory protein